MVQRQSVISSVADGAELVWVATCLPVQRWRDIPRFMGLSNKIATQVQHRNGAVRSGLKANYITKKFWTVSVWADRAAMWAFVQAEPHKGAMPLFEGWAGEGAAFVEWKAPDGPIDWRDVERCMQNPTFYFKKRKAA